MSQLLKELQPYLRRLHHLHDLPDSLRDRITGKLGDKPSPDEPAVKPADKASQ